jgi:membrane-bound lytic murein transglycosylase A
VTPERRLLVIAGLSALIGALFGATFALRLQRPEVVVRERSGSESASTAEAGAVYTPMEAATLPGWTEDTVVQALPSLKRSCKQLQRLPPETVIGIGPIARAAKSWHAACAILNDTPDSDAAVRAALERAFVPYRVTASWGAGRGGNPRGQFTGYYEAELNGSLVQTGPYQVPIYGPPRNLITANVREFLPKGTRLPSGMPDTLVGRLDTEGSHERLLPYYTREEIDRDGAIADDADVLVWADDPVAVHILHIQGSGRVTLPDGQVMRIGFAGQNGHAFKGLSKILVEAGVLPQGNASMIAVREWLRTHPDQARDMMDKNARYIFFRKIDSPDADGPIGALGVPLAAGRALAVDQRFIPLGAPVWLDTQDPDGMKLQRLVVAEDVGAAITGPVRGDLFWGHGEDAFNKAARMNSAGSYFVFVPRAVSVDR